MSASKVLNDIPCLLLSTGKWAKGYASKNEYLVGRVSPSSGGDGDEEVEMVGV